ncbi:Ppx/GppA family phosphatase [Campylobacter troglodytis]|uniref:Ppx/GppA phosphatase family protein n=1 Tax=Campylobacter troglodytis TaxID=654363 RepID=UPI0011582B76|nr:Ppx/GppA family phosphatase [Campylobacter troglodytis]TQR61314.1 exopolyphosphatase [Campylobacter troglodytis]
MIGIDLGSNTLRAIEMNEEFQTLKEAEFIIGAAKNLEKTGRIETEALERLKNALFELKKQGFDLKNANSVATAAFRKASNTNEIFENLKTEFGIKFRVIEAKEEARLSILGMKNALKKVGFKETRLAFCDLGGASCELSFDKELQSFDFGIISFYERVSSVLNSSPEFNLKINNLSKLERKKRNKIQALFARKKDKRLKLHFLLEDKLLRALAFKAFEEIRLARKQLVSFKANFVVLNSGVPTTVSALKQGINYEDYEARLINGKFLRRGDFLFWGLKIWQMSKDEANLRVGKNRKNYLVAGCFLLYALFEKERLVVVDEGLREGACIEALTQI